MYRLNWDFSESATEKELTTNIFRREGLGYGHFAIHPLELSRPVIYQQFWQWWTEEYSC